MAEIDDEIIARALRWCAEAGRQASAAEVRAALAPLSWDELLAARAVLADPPPTRPLGPRALADIARGTAPDVAAERQRDGRYAEERGDTANGERDVPPSAPAPPAPRTRGRRKRLPAELVIRRVRDRPEPQAAAAPPSLPPIDELHRAEGRAAIEQLLRRHGGRRARVVAALSDGWRHADGSPPGYDDLAALLDVHGLARAFERRERDEAIHAVRAAGGMLRRAAADLGVEPELLPTLLERVGAAHEVAAIRARKRDELRGRATLSERARLLCEESDRLADLELRAEFEDDLRARLPELLRALRATGKSALSSALADSLALPRAPVDAMVRRLGIDLSGAPRRSDVPGGSNDGGPRATTPRPHARADPPARAGLGGSRPPVRGSGPSSARGGGAPRRDGPRPGPRQAEAPGRGARPAAPRTGVPRTGARSSGAGRGPSPSAGGSRAGAARAGAERTAAPRAGPPRTGARRTGAPGIGPPRAGPPRTGAQRRGKPRTDPPRTGAPRTGKPRPGKRRRT